MDILEIKANHEEDIIKALERVKKEALHSYEFKKLFLIFNGIKIIVRQDSNINDLYTIYELKMELRRLGRI